MLASELPKNRNRTSKYLFLWKSVLVRWFPVACLKDNAVSRVGFEPRTTASNSHTYQHFTIIASLQGNLSCPINQLTWISLMQSEAIKRVLAMTHINCHRRENIRKREAI